MKNAIVGFEAAQNAEKCEGCGGDTDHSQAGFATTITTNGVKEFGWFFNDAHRAACHCVETAARLSKSGGYAVGFGAGVLGAAGGREFRTMGSLISGLAYIGALVCLFIGVFDMRKSLVTHYNSVEPIGLKLSGVMTFFFHFLYFQYHFTRIAALKQTGART